MTEPSIIELSTNNRLHPAAQRAMESLKDRGVSLATLEAIVGHCNPFPDKQIKAIQVPTGAQDVIVYPSMKQASLSKPAALPNAKWGFCVIQHPFADTNSADTAEYHGDTGAYSWTGATGVMPMNGFFAGFCFQDNGQDLDFVSLQPESGTYAELPGEFYVKEDELLTHAYKIVGQGFEASDVTPELYKGGTYAMAEYEPVTVYEQATVTRSGPVTNKENVTFCSNWPKAYSEMAKSKTFQTWEAPKGCYVPNTYRQNVKLPASSFTQKKFNDLVISPGNTQYTQVVRLGSSVRDSGYRVKVSVFRGLDPNAVFNIRRILYFTAQVPPESGTFLLAHPEPAFDPKFDEMLTIVTKSMPAGTVFLGNALGSWFDTLCDVISGVADGVGTLVPGVSWIGAGAKWAKGVNNGFRGKAERTPEPRSAQELTMLWAKFGDAYQVYGKSCLPKKMRGDRDVLDFFNTQLLTHSETGFMPPNRPKKKLSALNQTMMQSADVVPAFVNGKIQMVSRSSKAYKQALADLRRKPWLINAGKRPVRKPKTFGPMTEKQAARKARRRQRRRPVMYGPMTEKEWLNRNPPQR